MFNSIIPWKRKDQPAASGGVKPESFFDRMLTDWSNFPERFFSEEAVFPKVDITEGKRDIRVKAEIPGVESDDIDVSLDGSRLIISGEKKQENKEENENYHRIEHTYGSFHRAVELPADVDPDDVDAKFKRGVLKLKLKKTKESQSAKIKVKSS